MKPMLDNRYVTWMAMRQLTFDDQVFEAGDKVPQKLLTGMRDPEVLVRTHRLAAVAKDMNKVPRMLRKDVMDEKEARAKFTTPRFVGQIGKPVSTPDLERLEGASAKELKIIAAGDEAERNNPTRYASQPVQIPEPVEVKVEDDEAPTEAAPTRPEVVVDESSQVDGTGALTNPPEDTTEDTTEDTEVDNPEGEISETAGQTASETPAEVDTPKTKKGA